MQFNDNDKGHEIKSKLNSMWGTWEEALTGIRGWSPLIELRVEQNNCFLYVRDWVGGRGEKPEETGYVTSTGLSLSNTNAVNVKGVKGDTGTAATLTLGTVATGAAGSSVVITQSGTSGARVLNFTIPRGDKGEKGDKGNTGEITQVNVTTGLPGSDATLSNSGTSTEAVLNFTIPRGDKGDKGDKGNTGEKGDNSWTPLITVTSRGEDRVFKVYDWINGTGTKPQTNVYLADSGFVQDVNLALNVRGAVGTVENIDKSSVGLGNVDNTSDLSKPISTLTQTALDNKVDKVAGKGLSDQNFTSAYKTKLDNIAEEANNYTLPSANATRLGGVKQGTNVSIDSNGVLSVPDGTVSAKGLVQLSTSVTSTSTALAATASAVKSAYDLANGKQSALTTGTAAEIDAGTVTTVRNWSPSVLSDAISLIPQNSKSADYTLTLADRGRCVLHPSADTTARTFTIPANTSVAFPISTAIAFVNQAGTGGIVTIACNDTMRLANKGLTGSRTLARNGIAVALKVTATEWIITGVGLT